MQRRYLRMSAPAVSELMRPGAVHRALYVDPDLFSLEQERIFRRAWIYLCHESEIARPGDYVLSHLGLDEVIVARQADGGIAAMHNRCPHRGARVVAQAHGSARGFTCPYHAWSFGLGGALDGVPLREGYVGGAPCGEAGTGLARVARVASYRGFVFGCAAAQGPDLPEFLGGLASALDNMVDRAPDGALEQAGGRLSMEYRGNWKMFMENAVDLVHPQFVHGGSVAAARDTRAQAAAEGAVGQATQMLLANGLRLGEWDKLGLRTFPHGHVYMDSFYRDGVIASKRDDEVFERYRRLLVRSRGEQHAREILAVDRFNNLIWPTLSVNSRFQTIRVVQPLAPDRTVVRSYCFRLAGAPAEMFELSLRFLNTASSPASLVASDDLEIFERCQQGLSDSTSDWIDISRAMGGDAPGEDGSFSATGTSELPIRNQMRAWRAYMEAA
jgi:phenylpropionate dioxygenase-like ring-hydroxylating dioxygenase large terminal subunit